MKATQIPVELRTVIDSEPTDFIIKSARNYPIKSAYGLLVFSLFWNGFVGFFIFIIARPLFKGEEVRFKSNDVPTSASLENLEPLVVPGIFIGLFALVGIGMFIGAMVLFFQKGGYFVGTKTRLIKYRKGEITVTDWEQFSGNIKMQNKSDLGDLELELRTGKMKSRNKGSDKFVPDSIFISGVKNVFEIEKKCRVRIKENDPTPKIVVDTAYD